MTWTTATPTEEGFYIYLREYKSPETGKQKYAPPRAIRTLFNARQKLVAEVNHGTFANVQQMIGFWLKLPEFPKINQP